MSHIENILINKNTTLSFFDNKLGNDIVLTQKNVSKYFSYVYVLVKKNDIPIESEFYNWQVPKELFDQVNSNLMIVRVSVKILKNNYHFNNMIMLTKKQLSQYNIFNYNLDNNNIIVPILNISYRNLLNYLEQYESTNTLENIYNLKIINNYFNIDIFNYMANEQIEQMINNLDDSIYWTRKYNCSINNTLVFHKRKITFQLQRLTDKNIASIIKRYFNKRLTNNNEDENYLHELNNKTSTGQSKKKYVKTKPYKPTSNNDDESKSNNYNDGESKSNNYNDGESKSNNYDGESKSNIYESETKTNNHDQPPVIIHEDNSESEDDTKCDMNYLQNRPNYISQYKIGPKSELNNDNIFELFLTLSEKQRFLLFSNLLISKKNCHLVINNIKILKLMKALIKKYALLFRYLISYAWICFYSEESIKQHNIKTNDRFIFDINTIAELPRFPFEHINPKHNPYMPLLVADSELCPSKNLCGLPDYYNTKVTFQSTSSLIQVSTCSDICNLEEFKKLMNIFCTGDPDNDLFENFDFAKYKVAISGSVITACLQKNHPLMLKFQNYNEKNKTLQENNKIKEYFNEYYAKSDIDVMFMVQNDFEFIDNVKCLYEQILLNVCKFNSSFVEPAHVKLILNKVSYLFVSEKFINEHIHIDEQIAVPNKLTYIINNINEEFVLNLFKPHYEKMKTVKYNEIIKHLSEEEIDKLIAGYPDIFNFDEDIFRIYINKKSNNYSNKTEFKEDMSTISLNKNDIDLEFTYKYKIVSPYLNRPLEIFPTKKDDFMSLVAGFHLPCVRGYYDGSNVYLTPSCISAHMTFMNLDYRYVSGTKDHLDIINKNRMRGFGTWLNTPERKLTEIYLNKVPFWHNLYSDAKYFGTININHKLYSPRLYNEGDFTECMFVEMTNRYNKNIKLHSIPVNHSNNRETETRNIKQEIIDIHNAINIKNIDYNDFVAIDPTGCVKPVQKWIIEATWSFTN